MPRRLRVPGLTGLDPRSQVILAQFVGVPPRDLPDYLDKLPESIRVRVKALLDTPPDKLLGLLKKLAALKLRARTPLTREQRDYLAGLAIRDPGAEANANDRALAYAEHVARAANVKPGDLASLADRRGAMALADEGARQLDSDTVDGLTALWFLEEQLDADAAAFFDREIKRLDPDSQEARDLRRDFFEVRQIKQRIAAAQKTTQKKTDQHQQELAAQAADARTGVLYEETVPRLLDGEEIDPATADQVLAYHDAQKAPADLPATPSATPSKTRRTRR